MLYFVEGTNFFVLDNDNLDVFSIRAFMINIVIVVRIIVICIINIISV